MHSAQNFHPDWASPPGATIADILHERGMSVAQFGERLGLTPEQVAELLQGRAHITIGIARRLGHILGASVEFWMSRDFQYREDISRSHTVEAQWLSELPLGDMTRFGWIKPIRQSSAKLKECLRFFGVPSVSAWRQTYQGLEKMVVFRKSRSFDSRPAAVAAWLRQGEIEAESISCRSWNSKRFVESLTSIRSLTRRKDPRYFVPALQRICADSGVAVAVVRAPSGCPASGATRFLSQQKALLLLSFRYLSDDQFWFSFFHEAGHLLLHGENGFFLEGMETANGEQEQEANEFAGRTLVPAEFHASLFSLPTNSEKVIRFAVRVGVSPGVIVGQLQHYKKLHHGQLNTLKRRFTWED